MTDVSSITSATTTSSTASTATKTTEAGSVISSDFETFLKMLTVQMTNQDPLNPIESTDYAVQLATFSGVEQQVMTNDLLQAMSNQLSAMSMSDLAGWVGMEARAVASAWFDETPITLAPDPASGAQETWVVVRDAYGNDLDRIQIPISDATVQWAGVDASGEAYPAGAYTFYLQSYSQGELLAEDQMAVYAEIIEARAENGETMLVLAGGDEVPASEVSALRSPDAF